MTDKEKLLQAAAQHYDRVLAQRHLIDFCTHVDPSFQAPAHLRELASILERVERGEVKRVIVSLHPGSGKSTLLQYFGSWYLGRNPKRRIIATSAAERLAVRNSRAVRDIFGSPEWPFEARLSADATAAGIWETNNGGGLFAVGVGGVVTGWRAPLIICADVEDGQSSRIELDGIEEWFRSKLLTRLEPGGACIIVQQRWPNDDLPRRLMNGPRGDQWLYVRMPAIAEEDDALGRALGEPLWPERFDLAALEAIREDIGPRHFAAQFQGAPMNDAGNVIRYEWLQHYDRPPETFKKKIMALDAASKTGVRNDYSAIVVLGVTDNAYYVLDVIRRRVEFPDLQRMVRAAFERHEPSRIYVEDTSNATALIQTLKVESRLPVLPVKPIGSKESRVEAVTGTIEAGRVHLPKAAPWLADFEAELTEFPAGDHDDMVDAFCMALSQVAKKKFAFAMSVGDGYSSWTDSTGTTHTRYFETPTHYGSSSNAVSEILRNGLF